MQNKNRIIGMIQDSNIVYVDGKTIKDRDRPTEYNQEEETHILTNIDNYYITFFNRDISNGNRVLKLTTDHIL